MSRPRALDLFCGAGGTGVGLSRAGFEVVGVDNRPQPHYPFAFHQADALEFAQEHGHEFDVIFAGPPCQGLSCTKSMPWTRGYRGEIPNLIPAARDLLHKIGKPYVIENVVGASLVKPIRLCGLMFGLKVFRHRLFESNIPLPAPDHPYHNGYRVGRDGFVCCCGHGDAGRGRIPSDHRNKASWQAAMGIDWMTMQEMSQAIPPAYTEFIGRQLLRFVRQGGR